VDLLLKNIGVRVVIEKQPVLEIIEGGARVKVEQQYKMMMPNLSNHPEVYPSVGAHPKVGYNNNNKIQKVCTAAVVVLQQWVLVAE